MRLFISSDIEGSCGITAWEETNMKAPSMYRYFQEQMTREVAAACSGALAGGFTDILVKDAHDNARNLLPDRLPEKVRLCRGWDGHLLGMMSGIQDHCDAVAFTGYHAAAGSDGNPLAHSFATTVYELLINGAQASEFTINSLIAGHYGLPVIFISGDAAVCAQAKSMIPGITTVPVLEGRGAASVSGHPDEAIAMIQAGMAKAAASDWQACQVRIAQQYDIVLRLTTHPAAAKAANYPGAYRQDSRTVLFSASDIMEVCRFMYFVL